MLDTRKQSLSSLRYRFFVLWDTDGDRGWLVTGDTAALHLLRAHLKFDPPDSDFDFSTLNHVNSVNSSAYDVLKDWDNMKRVLSRRLKDVEEKTPEGSEDGEPPKDQEKVSKMLLGEVMDGIYAALIQMNDLTRPLNASGGLSGWFKTWYENKWGTTVRGWDFTDIAKGVQAQVYVHKLDKHPNLLKHSSWQYMTRELGATFLFANGLGEVMEPHAGSCCPHFPTLPKHQDFLASNMKVLGYIVDDFSGTTPGNKTVARLNRDIGWERDPELFKSPHCQDNHLDNLEHSCFPVQNWREAPIDRKNLDKDAELLEKKKGMFSSEEIKTLAKNFPNGVVVFGHRPNKKKLRELAQPIHQGNRPSVTKEKTYEPWLYQESDWPRIKSISHKRSTHDTSSAASTWQPRRRSRKI
ncbi:hypothetical protein Daus18300_010153 [Diaporthe australafricana]|uniref:Uncharacterized protein n=1 Tax=Diaporthe australafricana TaxID=127596 RepID=A0ABR3WBA9_9PEZI